MKLIKNFLKGLLYVILSPLIIAGFALYMVYSLFVYIINFCIATVKFFSGSKLTTDTKEDKAVKKLVIAKDKESAEKKVQNETTNEPQAPAPTPIVPPSGPTTINNFYITKDQFPFNNPVETQFLQNTEVKNIENKPVLEIEEKEGGNNNE